MKTIRVFDKRGRMIREFQGAISGSVGMNGALVVRMRVPDLAELSHGARSGPVVVVIAPGGWHELQEWDGIPPTDALTARPGVEQAPAPGVSGNTGHFPIVRPSTPIADQLGIERPAEPPATDPGMVRPYIPEQRRPPANPELTESLKRLCICEQLRCPVILNPAPAAELAWFRQPPHLRTGEPPAWVVEGREPAPLQRCSWETGHDAAIDPHQWIEGRWPYGVNEHHPKCPRTPGYGDDDTPGPLDTPTGPGQLAERARIAADLLARAGAHDAAFNLRVAAGDDPMRYQRDTDGDVTGAPIPHGVEGFHAGGRVPVVPGSGTMSGEG